MFIPSVKTVWWQGFASSYEVNLQFGGKGVGESGWGGGEVYIGRQFPELLD